MDNVLSKVKSTSNDILGKAMEAPQFLQKQITHPIMKNTMELKFNPADVYKQFNRPHPFN